MWWLALASAAEPATCAGLLEDASHYPVENLERRLLRSPELPEGLAECLADGGELELARYAADLASVRRALDGWSPWRPVTVDATPLPGDERVESFHHASLFLLNFSHLENTDRGLATFVLPDESSEAYAQEFAGRVASALDAPAASHPDLLGVRAERLLFDPDLAQELAGHVEGVLILSLGGVEGARTVKWAVFDLDRAGEMRVEHRDDVTSTLPMVTSTLPVEWHTLRLIEPPTCAALLKDASHDSTEVLKQRLSHAAPVLPDRLADCLGEGGELELALYAADLASVGRALDGWTPGTTLTIEATPSSAGHERVESLHHASLFLAALSQIEGVDGRMATHVDVGEGAETYGPEFARWVTSALDAPLASHPDLLGARAERLFDDADLVRELAGEVDVLLYLLIDGVEGDRRVTWSVIELEGWPTSDTPAFVREVDGVEVMTYLPPQLGTVRFVAAFATGEPAASGPPRSDPRAEPWGRVWPSSSVLVARTDGAGRFGTMVGGRGEVGLDFPESPGLDLSAGLGAHWIWIRGGHGLQVQAGGSWWLHRPWVRVRGGVVGFYDRYTGDALDLRPTVGVASPISVGLGPSWLYGLVSLAPAWVAEPSRAVAWSQPYLAFVDELSLSAGVGFVVPGRALDREDDQPLAIVFTHRRIAGGSLNGLGGGLSVAF